MSDDASRGRDDIAAGRLAALPDKLARLVLCHRALSAAQVETLDAVFPLIIALHRSRIRAVFSRLPAADIDDLTQVTFVKANARIRARGFHDTLELGPWLVQLARTERSNHLRGLRRSPLSLGLPSSSGEKPRSAGSEERAAAHAATYRRIRDSLSPQYREVLELVIEERLSVREAAEVLEVSTSTVNKRLLVAREALRAAFEVPESEPAAPGSGT